MRSAAVDSDGVAPELIRSVAALVRVHAGLRCDGVQAQGLRRGLRRVLEASGERPDVESLLVRLERDEDLFSALTSEIAVGETYFFRGPEQMAFLREHVLPELGRRNPGRPLRIWSAGCASGEEPYTLAILALQAGLGPRVRILGTDIDGRALARAREGRYRAWALRATEPEERRRYFTEHRGEFQLAREVKDLVEFRRDNLYRAPEALPAGAREPFDLIVCRNVLIYFDAEAAGEVGRRLCRALAPGGWLVAGPSDPLLSPHPGIRRILTEGGVAYRRGTGRRRRSERPRGEPGAERRTRPARTLESPTRPTGGGPEPPPPARSKVGEWTDEKASVAVPDTPEQSPERSAESAELHLFHGLALAEAGSLEEAVAAFRRALYLDRGHPLAHAAFGGIQALMGNRRGALRSLRNARRILATLNADEKVSVGEGPSVAELRSRVEGHLRLLEDMREP